MPKKDIKDASKNAQHFWLFCQQQKLSKQLVLGEISAEDYVKQVRGMHLEERVGYNTENFVGNTIKFLLSLKKDDLAKEVRNAYFKEKG